MYVFRKVRGFFAPPKFRSYATALSGALNMLIVLPFIANKLLLLPYSVCNQNQTPLNQRPCSVQHNWATGELQWRWGESNPRLTNFQININELCLRRLRESNPLLSAKGITLHRLSHQAVNA